ncbi:hypothetical protein ACLVWU_10925 [Bdellovibrio sp. HCB290]|uniref:hypothetical protein n=1 Tax=Bdellovibrio sp. HCB290 TaxID=3394356 RepID=UPI0039B3A394
MKSLFLSLSILFTASLSLAIVGGDESSGTRNGGNTIASDFYERGVTLLNQLKPRSPVSLEDRDIEVSPLIALFQKTKLVVSDVNLYLDGSLVDAINYPKLNKIEISSLTWKTLNSQDKNQLVIHEILGVAGLPDPLYRNSQELLEVARVGINWERGYRPPCNGPRALNKEQSAQLYSALHSIYTISSKGIMINYMRCMSGKNVLGEPYKRCEDSRTEALGGLQNTIRLINAFEFAGVAKYIDRLMGPTEFHTIFGLSCTVNSSTKIPNCTLNSYWKSNCPK